MAMIFLSDEDRAGGRSVNWILEDLTNGVAIHFTIQYGTVNGKRVAHRHGHCEKCIPNTPRCANSILFRSGNSPKCSGVAGAFFTPRLLGLATAPDTLRVEQPCSFGTSSLPYLN